MHIRIVSSLTPDDENRMAPALLETLKALLLELPVVYALRIETTSGEIWQQQNVGQATASDPVTH
jgi:hypothetical protein